MRMNYNSLNSFLLVVDKDVLVVVPRRSQKVAVIVLNHFVYKLLCLVAQIT